MCDSIPHDHRNPKTLFEENKKMSRLPLKLRNRLKKEATAWDTFLSKERPEEVQELLEQTEVFQAGRPPGQPVSIRVDPFDLSLAKRIARRKGIPFTQLMSMWLHEKLEQEKTSTGA
jgi:predicted DNA binding CopG/RHH family protein